jgi:hypothetical protein
MVGAKADTGFVRIMVEQVYAAAHFPAGDWPSILAISDAASGWTASKLLFRKKSAALTGK